MNPRKSGVRNGTLKSITIKSNYSLPNQSPISAKTEAPPPHKYFAVKMLLKCYE